MSRTIGAQALQDRLARGDEIVVLDVRRQADYDADPAMVPGAQWRDPERIQDWQAQLPREREIVIYCARGGSVSNSVLDRLLKENLKACFVEGGIAALKAVRK